VAFQIGDGPRVNAVCHDISLGGMFIETDQPGRFGEAIRVLLTLPGLKSEAVVQATVRWTKPTGMGVQFGVMGARETHALTQLLG
jgi:type IV pilus assembly protein PilZ